MTAQIGDIYKYQKKEFTVVALSSVMLFDPKITEWSHMPVRLLVGGDIGVNMRLKMMNCC